MPSIAGTSLEVSNRLIQADNLMIKLSEHLDTPLIVDWQLKHPSMWRDRIPMAKYPAFKGDSQTQYIYRGSNSAPQAGLVGWRDVTPSAKPVGGVGGTDRCNYAPETFTWSFDSVGYSGKRREWMSPVFCVMDLYTQDAAKEQLAFIVSAAAEVTDQTREVYSRESYMKIASDAKKFVVLAEGMGLSFFDSALCRVTYDPQAVDADGDTYIEFDASLAGKVSTLNWSPFNLIRSYMADAAPDAGVGSDSGMPVFSLLIDIIDFETFIFNDANVREDMRYANPEQLIKGYNMGFRVYRGMAITHDVRQARFSGSTITGGKLRCKRVLPRRATRTGVVGTIPEINPNYATAEFGTAVLFLNNVAQILVPDTLSNLGSGLTFGPAPGFNGQWSWVNIKDNQTNPLGETGYLFSRFEYHLKPMRYAEHAMVLLYRRCTQVVKTGCAVEAASDSVDEAFIASAPAAADFDATLCAVTLTLASKLSAGLSDKVTITNDAGSTFTAYILEDKNAPTYKFGWVSGSSNAPTAVTEINDPTITKVTVA